MIYKLALPSTTDRGYRILKRKFQAGRFAGIAHGRTRLYEHAETGKPAQRVDLVRSHLELVPPAARRAQRARPGRGNKTLQCAAVRCASWRSNGPTGFAGQGGHKLSAVGLPLRKASHKGLPTWPALHVAARRLATPRTSLSTVIHLPRPASFRSDSCLLAASPGRICSPGGKVRWQKRFAFPPRRMKRGWQF